MSVVAATIRSNPHLLGQQLIKTGRVASEDLTRAQGIQQGGDNRRIGAILVALGALSAKELAVQVRAQIEEVGKVLAEIGADGVPQIVVWNKIDLVPGLEPGVDRDEYGRICRVRVSARTGAGIVALRSAIAEFVVSTQPDRADAPLADALAMMVRERLTGLAPPQAARKMVDLWRPVLEDKIGPRLDRLKEFTEDQSRFGDVVHDLLDALEQPGPYGEGGSGLTERQREVLSLAARGYGNKEIAVLLRIAERTVQFHFKSIFVRAGVNGRAQAVAHALRMGWIS